ncbi:hypothetical protein GM418_08605 [Maribellus comscasis]|uniref:Uncharacterized protein n=1 Tax=Maribellus comscasis TaxID=2681766 RepID=A0A6I6K1B0_9BACT|nr:hypothetical protein [Maribellus comscasis]QGY43714.1 hypothetical protein GM418_08605 [Maribellus comscasis]
MTARFDFAYINPGFDNFVSVEQKIKEGFKVVIVIENGLQREDNFYTTQFYPFSVFIFKRRIKQYNKMKNLVKLAPHLVRSQKVFYPDYSSLGKYYAIIADYFFENTYQFKSQTISKGTRSIFSNLRMTASRGIYFQEYTINISRFYIEMLKYFREIGVEILVNHSFKIDDEKLILADAEKEIQVSQIVLGNNLQKNIYEFSTGAPRKFSMFVNNPIGNFRFKEENGYLQVEPESDSVSYSKGELIALVESYFQLNFEEVKAKKKNIFQFSLDALSSLFTSINKGLPCAFDNADFGDMFELCREKFDLAKQCGINFPEFQVLFHRYGEGIDEMIEMAYEKINERRDSQSIWADVESEFQKKYEWKI